MNTAIDIMEAGRLEAELSKERSRADQLEVDLVSKHGKVLQLEDRNHRLEREIEELRKEIEDEYAELSF